jgi:hypothetical protein
MQQYQRNGANTDNVGDLGQVNVNAGLQHQCARCGYGL